MKVIVIVLFIVLFVLFLFFLLSAWNGQNKLYKYLEESGIIFGPKGSGKTMICQKYANHCHKGYATNGDFGRKFVKINGSDINVGQNTFENVLKGIYYPIKKNNLLEARPIILDDAGVYFPNIYDDKLRKLYPSMPIAFALWRHLYDAPIHINSQDIDRVWKLLREQQSVFIKALGTSKLPFGFLRVKYRYYSKRSSAQAELDPYKKVFGNKYAKAEKQQFESTNGIIKDHFIIIHKSHIYYDTRYFHRVFFGESMSKVQSKILLNNTYKVLQSSNQK